MPQMTDSLYREVAGLFAAASIESRAAFKVWTEEPPDDRSLINLVVSTAAGMLKRSVVDNIDLNEDQMITFLQSFVAAVLFGMALQKKGTCDIPDNILIVAETLADMEPPLRRKPDANSR